MTYVIADPCRGTKDGSCLEVCPVDCIHPTKDDVRFKTAEQLYIDPEVCIECDACVLACPTGAPMPAELLPEHWQEYEQINADFFNGERT
jgi:ferredoxin